MLKFSKLRSVVLAVSMITLAGVGPALAETFAVVVNVENSFSGDDATVRTQVKRLYLKEQSKWPGGVAAVPFGRGDGSAEQSAFDSIVLGMTTSDLDGHWLKLKQIRGETPPRGIGSARILARQIGKQPGAFGVVLSSEAGAIENGKILFEFSSD